MPIIFRSLILILLLLLYIQNGHTLIIDNQALDNLYHQYRQIGDDIEIDRQTMEVLNESAHEMGYSDFLAAANMVSIPNLLLMVSNSLLSSEILSEIEKTKINHRILRRLSRMKEGQSSIELFEKNIIVYSHNIQEDPIYCLSRIPLLKNHKSITNYLIGCYNKAQEIDQKIQVLNASHEITDGFLQEYTLAVEKAVYKDIRHDELTLDGCLALSSTLRYVHLKEKAFSYCPGSSRYLTFIN